MRLQRWLFFFACISVLSSCAEPAGTGEPTLIPKVYVDCETPWCKSDSTPQVLAVFTTSGCDSPYFGIEVSGSIHSLSCTSSSGCYGEISDWTDSLGRTQKIPSGVYSICVRIDHNRDYPGYPDGPSAGDSWGVLDNVHVSSSTGSQLVSNWIDVQ